MHRKKVPTDSYKVHFHEKFSYNQLKKIGKSLIVWIFLSQNGKRVKNHSFPPLPLHLLLPFNNVIEQKQEEHDKSIYFHLGHILRQRLRQLTVLNQLAVFRAVLINLCFLLIKMVFRFLSGLFRFYSGSIQVHLGSLRSIQVLILFGIRFSIITWTDNTQKKVWLSLERGSSSPFQRRFFTPNTTHFLCVLSRVWCTKTYPKNMCYLY